MSAARRGAKFAHKHLIVGSPKAGTARPNVCTVTAVRGSTVYYRSETGMALRIAKDKLAGIVGQWIED